MATVPCRDKDLHAFLGKSDCPLTNLSSRPFGMTEKRAPLPPQFGYDTPYLERRDAPKGISAKRLRDYVREASVKTRVLGLVCFILASVYLIVEPLVQCVHLLFVFVTRLDTRNPYCQSNAKARWGMVISKNKTLDGRNYVTRYYDPLRDVVPHLCASGFSTDPFLQFVVPSDWLRHRYSTYWYRLQLDSSGLDTIVQEWVDQNKLVGVASISQREPTVWDEITEMVPFLAMLMRWVIFSPTSAYRTARVTLALLAKQYEVMEQFSQYGFVSYLRHIAVEKGFQGQGLGSAMLRTLTAHWDSQQMYAYLECSTAANVPFYERFGFRVFEEHYFCAEGSVYFLMVRAPRAPATASTSLPISTPSDVSTAVSPALSSPVAITTDVSPSSDMTQQQRYPSQTTSSNPISSRHAQFSAKLVQTSSQKVALQEKS